MANTYELISSTVATGSQATITFSSIPSTYTDILLRVSARMSSTTLDTYNLAFNGSTANFSYRNLYGAGTGALGSSTGSSGATGINEPSTYTANTFGSMDLYIPNYATSQYKSASSIAVSENNSTEAYAVFTGNVWSSTSAITSISITSAGTANFAQYSSFYLYGIKNS